MNQILITKEYNKKQKIKIFTFKLQFYISLISFIIIMILFSSIVYSNTKKEQESKVLTNSFNISTLYDSYVNDIDKLSAEPFVIGIIEIEKIKINYPILSNQNDELLKIAPCRFAGPLPNKVGNLCIAGHNYADKRFFGKLKELSINDKITIYDLSGNSLDYFIYERKEISPNDLSCMSQETNEEKIVTLITCNNMSDKRLLIKAKTL